MVVGGGWSGLERVCHGDVGACVLHCLRVDELARFAGVSQHALHLVQRKWTAYRALDLTLYPLLPRRALQLLCSTVLGVETLVVDVAETLLLQHASWRRDRMGPGHGIGVEQALEQGAEPDWASFGRFATSLLTLVDRNASTLSAIHVRLQGPVALDVWQSLTAGLNELFLQPLFARAANLPKLHTFSLPSPQTLLHGHPLLSVASLTPPRAFNMSVAAAALAPPSLPFSELRVLSGLMYSTRYLHRLLSPIGASSRCGVYSLRLCFPWPRAHGSHEMEQCLDEQLREGNLPPHHLDQLSEEESDAMREVGVPVLSIERLHSVLQQVRFRSSLLYLSMQLYTPYMGGAVLRLDLPCLLQLGVESDVDTGLVDVDLNLPQLRSLGMHLELRNEQSPLSVREQHAAQRAAEGLPPDQNDHDIGDDDEEAEDIHEQQQRLLYILPPSLLSSLARSTRLRYLCLPLCGPGTPSQLPDYALGLDAPTRHRMDARAQQLGCASPFDEVQSGLRKLRVLLYALSLLPFAPQLRLFEDCHPLIPWLEHLQLFPSVVSVSTEPDYDTGTGEVLPAWFRPPADRYGLRLDFVHLQVVQRQCDSWDRLALHTHTSDGEEGAAESARLASADEHKEVMGYLSLCHAKAQLRLESLAPVLALGRFARLSVLYLSAPTSVECAAVSRLIEHCTLLSSLSLIQLSGVTDDAFYFAEHGFVRPALRTLKLKNVCSETRVRTGLPALSVMALSRAAALFPALTELDVTHFSSASAVISTLTHLLLSTSPAPRWPHLRSLIVPLHAQDAACVHVLAALRHTLHARATSEAAKPSASSGATWLLGCVQTHGQAHGLVDDGQWMQHARSARRREWSVLPGLAKQRFGFVEYVEASCFDDYCVHEPAAEAEAEQEEMHPQQAYAMEQDQ